MARMIDADALLNDNVWLCGGFVGDPYSDGYMDALDKVEAVIREFPIVDAVEVVHGRWTEAEDGDGAVCSVCGEDFCNVYLEVERFLYCPNCGANMR